MAASKSSYEEITGKKFEGADINIAPQDVHQTSIVQDENSPKLPEKVDTILAKIEKMEHGYDYIKHLGKTFECVICKSIVKQPIVSNRLYAAKRF